MLGGDGEVWPSRGVHLCRVKEVHSVLISYGHQVLSHLREHKNWGWEKETTDKFQLPIGRPWRALCREDNTVEIHTIAHHVVIVSRSEALKHFYNWKHRDSCSQHLVFGTEAIRAKVKLTFHTNRGTTELSPHQRSVIQMSPRCLDERRGHRCWFCFEALKQRWVSIYLFILPAFKPTHLTRGRKHGGLTFPGSCGKREKGWGSKDVRLRYKQWKETRWCAGILNTFACASIKGEIVSDCKLMCVQAKQKTILNAETWSPLLLNDNGKVATVKPEQLWTTQPHVLLVYSSTAPHFKVKYDSPVKHSLAAYRHLMVTL